MLKKAPVFAVIVSSPALPLHVTGMTEPDDASVMSVREPLTPSNRAICPFIVYHCVRTAISEGIFWSQPWTLLLSAYRSKHPEALRGPSKGR